MDTDCVASALVSTLYNAQSGSTILLADGSYALGGQILQLRAEGVSLRGHSGDPDKVILDGQYAADSGEVIANTSALIANDYANAPFVDRGSGTSAMSEGNLDHASTASFVDAAQGDLHLRAARRPAARA